MDHYSYLTLTAKSSHSEWLLPAASRSASFGGTALLLTRPCRQGECIRHHQTQGSGFISETGWQTCWYVTKCWRTEPVTIVTNMHSAIQYARRHIF